MRWIAPALVGFLFASGALAQSEAVVLRYEPGPSCPDLDRFLSEVRSYTAKLQILPPGSSKRTFTVTTADTTDGVSGRLVIDEGDAQAVREVSGRTCAEVVSALALATALAVDPTALGDEVPSEPARAPEPPPPEPVAPSLPVSETPSTRLAVAAEGRVLGGLAEGALLGGGVVGEVEHGRLPALRLGLAWQANRSERLVVEAATAELALCPAIANEGPSSELRACFGIDLGRLSASGVGTDFVPAPTQHAFESSFEVALRLRLSVAGPLYAEVGAGGQAHLSRYAFRLHGSSPGAGDPTLYAQGLLGWAADLAVGIRIY